MRTKSTKFLILLGVLSEIAYLSFFLVKPIFGNSTDLKENPKFLFVLFLLFLLLFFYTLAINAAKTPKTIKIVFFFSILFNFTLIFTNTIASNDLFSYIFQGRQQSHFSQNPYNFAYDSLSQTDPLYSSLKTVWSKKPSLYGPSFLLVFNLLSKIPGNSLTANLLVFKAFFFLVNTLSLLTIYKMTKKALPALLFGWNPIILFELSLNNHGEALIILLILLSLLFICERSTIKNTASGFILLTISTLTKFTNLLLFPIFSFHVYKKTKKRKFTHLFCAILATALTTIVLYIPYWESPNALEKTISYSKEASPFPSPGKYLFGNTLSSFLFSLSALYVYISFLTAKFKNVHIIKSSTLILLSFFLLYSNKLLPWYLTPLITLTSLSSRKYETLALTICSFLIYTYAR
jgi:hypothetical protein